MAVAAGGTALTGSDPLGVSNRVVAVETAAGQTCYTATALGAPLWPVGGHRRASGEPGTAGT
jgi:hypothetical protein